MATFISTVNFTDRGARAIKDTLARAEAFRKSAGALGIEIRDIFWTLGSADGLIVFDAPDEEAATALMLQLATTGNVRTQTSRAYNAQEIGGILDKV